MTALPAVQISLTPCSRAWLMHLKPWHAVTHLREAAVKEAAAEAAARAAHLATTARARAKARTRADTWYEARAKAATQQWTWNIWCARLPKLPQMLAQPRCDDDGGGSARAWKLFLLTPRMLPARPAEHGGDGRRILLMRLQHYGRYFW